MEPPPNACRGTIQLESLNRFDGADDDDQPLVIGMSRNTLTEPRIPITIDDGTESTCLSLFQMDTITGQSLLKATRELPISFAEE